MPANPIANLLIVDDELAQMEALCNTLRTEGYSTTGLTSATAALNILQEQTFDLVLSDLMMPEMDGIALLRVALETDPNLVGIVMTGHGTVNTAVEAMQTGALDYILKPFKLSSILPVLTRALATRRLRMENIQLQEAVGIYKLSMAVAFALDFDAVLEKVADAALGHSRVRGVSILVPTQDGNELRTAAARGEDAPCVKDSRIPFTQALSNWIERNRERIAWSGEFSEVDLASDIPLQVIPRGLSIPMLSGGKFVGILSVSSEHSHRPLTRGQGKALNILSSAAASAIERASLLDRLRVAEDELRHAQKMEAIGRLAGGVAHDFNNLLTVINGYSDLLLLNEFAKGAPIRENLREIKKAGEQAAALTRQLLAFGRKQALQPKVLNLNSIVESNLKILRRIIGADIELVSDLDPNLGSVKADTGQIEQILMNLVVNARDAMPRGGRLTIETRNVASAAPAAQQDRSGNPGPCVVLAVTDTGSGMDQATQSRIFEPFFTTKESGRGTGLGLSIVYGVVKQSNGSIRVCTELGRGTMFTIYFPRVAEPAPVMETAATVLPVPAGSETVLLVEDNAVVRQLICTTLENAGYSVLSAGSPHEAMRIFERHERKPGLVVTDLIMPGMSGPVLVEELKRRNLALRVVYISGYADGTVTPNGYLDPAIPFIQKPFAADDLLGKVRQALDGNPVGIGRLTLA